MQKDFEDQARRVEHAQAALSALFPRLAAQRVAFSANPSPEHRAALQAVEDEAATLQEEVVHQMDALRAASGLPPEIFETGSSSDDQPESDALSRKLLTAETVASTFDIDAFLPAALARVESLLPPRWQDAEPLQASQLGDLLVPDAVLSLTRGTRLESEQPAVHRLRQALHIGHDYLRGEPLYDHFAGALLIPSLVKFAMVGPSLKHVGGERDARLQRLWQGPSDQVDATLFELLVAGACAEMGRHVEFITATSRPSADLRCHDPFPLVIECKRQAALSSYEIAEEATMRRLFLALRKACRDKGVSGTFELTLTTEASTIDLDDVVAKLIVQRLAPQPERRLVHPWGTTAFVPTPMVAALPEPLRLFSPAMLAALFDWHLDPPSWDGICCAIDTRGAAIADTVRQPLALKWSNVSQGALKKRTWAPANLFGAASTQIPPGEFGIVYVSYVEGARDEIADLRVNAFTERMTAFEHSAKIRVPIAVLSRLYPRPLNDGQPDLIESGVRYVSETYGEPLLFELFPTRVVT